MKVLSLFSGVGGLELGFERSGMKIVGQVEIDRYCQQVLTKHWPNIRRWGDIHEFNDMLESGSITVTADLICGGFPCQPFSTAGNRKGTEDDRWLWPEFYRTVCAVRPGWVVIENVPGLLSIDSGRVFAGILKDLSEAGYDAEWCVLSAAQVGAPHLRKRLFIVAYSNGNGREAILPDFTREESPGTSGCGGESGALAHTHGIYADGGCGDEGQPGIAPEAFESVLGGVLDGLSGGMDGDWPTGPGEPQHGWEPARTVISEVPQRCARLKCLGNAVVPQVAEIIGGAIMSAAGEVPPKQDTDSHGDANPCGHATLQNGGWVCLPGGCDYLGEDGFCIKKDKKTVPLCLHDPARFGIVDVPKKHDPAEGSK